MFSTVVRRLPELTVHVLGEPVLPAALDVLLPAFGASGSFSADQLAQFLDPANVFHGRVAAAVPDDGGQVDRGTPLAGRSFQDGFVHAEDVPQQVRVHLLVPGLGPEVRGDVRDVRDRQRRVGAAAQDEAEGRQQQRVSRR